MGMHDDRVFCMRPDDRYFQRLDGGLGNRRFARPLEK